MSHVRIEMRDGVRCKVTRGNSLITGQPAELVEPLDDDSTIDNGTFHNVPPSDDDTPDVEMVSPQFKNGMQSLGSAHVPANNYGGQLDPVQNSDDVPDVEMVSPQYHNRFKKNDAKGENTTQDDDVPDVEFVSPQHRNMATKGGK
ncbi:MAG: hypothetical protein JW993_18330 [Sedimentisphaerales bacterium]|nr:hypothetical protein [Sedimentisphaerales bacterium]